MADDTNITPLRKALDPATDASIGFGAPQLSYGLSFRDYGSYGLKQYGGWVREEFMPELMGREAQRAFREMADNNSTVGSMLFAIIQAMRGVNWRVEPAGGGEEDGDEWSKFVEECMDDMSHTWEQFIAEALTMLIYGFAPHEIVYKRRLGRNPRQKFLIGAMPSSGRVGAIDPGSLPESKFDDGRIGWRRLPIRGQDTVLKWMLDANGQIVGMTQQPWVGNLIDLPISKLLLFRPTAHKNNPEGRSILRSSYRAHYMTKRLEEIEAILYERMGGIPVIYLPNAIIDAANATGPSAAQAKQVLDAYKKMATNIRVDEQMGVVLPSDPYKDADGKISSVRMFEFTLATPQHGRGGITVSATIERYKVDTLMTLLADFIHMGHETRGTNNLAVTKVDMFYSAIEGWLDSIASVLNNYAVPRLWKINAFDDDDMPQLKPDMPKRLDLDSLGNFIKNVAAAGMPFFPNEELENYVRDAAGMPDLEDGTNPEAEQAALMQRGKPQPGTPGGEGAKGGAINNDSGSIKRVLMKALYKEMLARRAAA
jgi:hypothetical protein